MSSFDSTRTPSKQIWSSSNNTTSISTNSTPSTSNSNKVYRSNSVSTIPDAWNTLSNSSKPSSSTTNYSIDNNNNKYDDDVGSGITGSAIGGVVGEEEEDRGEWELPTQEIISVSRNSEPSGSFLLKHLVYSIHTLKTASVVERRYSDWIWLSDCFIKRYPFRILPSLPPKQLNLGVTYIATDDLFLERRRKGLARFLNFALNHPTLRNDHLLRTFLTEPSDLSIWKKTASYTLEEESTSRILTSLEEKSIPSSFESNLKSLILQIHHLVEEWTELSRIFERLAHRLGNQGRDYAKFKAGLESCVEVERELEGRTREMEIGERKNLIVGEFVGRAGELNVSTSMRQIEGTVEELKRHRELYINFRDLLSRQVRLSPDGVDKLRKRTEVNIQKLETLRHQSNTNGSTASTKSNQEQEIEALTSAIESDQRIAEKLLRRRSFIRWCMYQEFIFLQRSTGLLSLALKEFATDELVFTERSKSNWSMLVESL